MNTSKYFIKKAIDNAKKSVNEGGFPAGAVVVREEEIIGEGLSIGNITLDPTSHGEIAAIRAACLRLKTANLEGSVLFTSLQPCVMCFSAAYWAGVAEIIYTGKKTQERVNKFYYEGRTDTAVINQENNRQLKLTYIPELESGSQSVVKHWETKHKKQE